MFESTPIGGITSDMEDCALFTFIVEFCIMGLICLLGIGGNTTTCIVLWQEASLTAPIFLLQVALLADIATVWILFLAEGIPALEYTTDALQNCVLVCGYVTIITRPLLFLAQFSSVWFSVLALYRSYIVVCKPRSPEQALSIDLARKQAVGTVLVGLLLTLPLTFDTAIHLNANKTLFQNFWYQILYLQILLFLAAIVCPLLLAAYFCLRLALVVRSVNNLRRILIPSYRLENMDMTQVMLGIGVMLVVCSLPQIALNVSHWISKDAIQTHCGSLHYYLQIFANLFMTINAGSKVIILCVLSRRFKSKLLQQFCSHRQKSDVYQCADRSEMTLISHMESQSPTHTTVEDNPVIRLLASTSTIKDYCTEK